MKHLRPYQERGKCDIFREWDLHDLLFFQLTTGGGKTVIFSDVIMDFLLKGKRVLMIAHRTELISQAWKTLFDNNIYAGVIQSSVSHIFHNGKAYAVDNQSLPAQVCSIQTIARRKQLPPADLIVIDEGHHVTSGNSYGAILKLYPHAKVLIVSATPYRLSGEGFENIVPGKVTRLIRNSSLAELQADGWLVPLKYFASYIPDMESVTVESTGDYNEEQAYEKMQLAPMVESYLEHAAGLQGLSFAVNVKHSISLAGQYWRHGIPAEHVDADTPDEKRQQINSDFRSGLVKVVCNVDIFTEGTDFPGCEFVQLGKPTKSLSKHLQKVGRGTRTVAGLVDSILTAEDRRAAIAASAKPHCVILDCCGAIKEHYLPDHPHNWEMYFKGWKDKKREKKPVDGNLEMLVYVAEDESGKRHRTANVKEIEGMRLIEVTQEVRRKMVNVTSIKEFDRQLLINSSQYTQKQPGYKTVRQYISYCEQYGILMTPEHWDYIFRKLVVEVQDRQRRLESNRTANSYPDSMYKKATSNIGRIGVTEAFLKEQRREYMKRNQSLFIQKSEATASWM